MFSVIIPVFNGAGFLDATLNSALEQSCRDLEILVVDDCSTDGSAEIVEHRMQADARIRLIRHETNHGGPYSARNTALDEAAGDYLVFLDQDDLLIPGGLEGMASLIASGDSDLVRGLRISLKDGREKVMNEFLPDPPRLNATFAGTPELWCGQHFASWAFRRELIEDAGLRFKPFIGHDDKVFLLCALAHSKRVTVDTVPLIKYRRHHGSLQGRRNLREMFHDMQAHAAMMRCLQATGHRDILAFRFSRWDFPTIAGTCAWAATWGAPDDRRRFQAAAREILSRPEIRQLELKNEEARTMRSLLLEGEEPDATRFLRHYNHRLRRYPAWRVLWNTAAAALGRRSASR
jgi:glycosyltransferase involved in cell wall biosynthesis